MPPALRLASLAVVVTAAAYVVAPPRTAGACSPLPCWAEGHFVPADGATVPANLSGIYWRPRRDNAEPLSTRVTLTTAADPDTPLAFTVMPAQVGGLGDYVLVPAAPLVPGTRYVVTDGNACSADAAETGPRVTFTVGPTAPLPTTLGVLAVTRVPVMTRSVSTMSGSCRADAMVDGAEIAVDLAAIPDAAPWRDALLYQTYVDGVAWSPRSDILASVAPGASWQGRGTDLVHTVCSSIDDTALGLPAGAHQVEIRATLPGSSIAITSESTTVVLSCDDGAGGCSSSPQPGGAAGLALVVLACVARRRRLSRALVRASVVALVAAAALVAAPRTAEACSASCVDPGFFVPGDGATVPANLPGIYWRARYDASGAVAPSNVTLTTAADPSTPLAFTATLLMDHHYLLVPDAPLVEGTSYRLTDTTMCTFGGGQPSPTVTFAVGPAAPLPTTIGTLAVTDLPVRTDTVASTSGSCSLEAIVASAAISVDYVAVPEAAPWRDVLHFQTFVDGQPWHGRANILGTFPPGASWVGRGFDRLVSVCRVDNPFADENDVSAQVSQGTHQVEMRATLPGTSLMFATGTRPVTLTCPALPDGDAGVDDDGGTSGEAPGGCCSSSTSPGGAAGLALAVVALLTRPARRRRPCR